MDTLHNVIPAQAGIQRPMEMFWTPACAGVTKASGCHVYARVDMFPFSTVPSQACAMSAAPAIVGCTPSAAQ